MTEQFEEYIELAANYGIDVSVPDRFYESQKLLLVEIMKHLQRIDKVVYRNTPRLHNERSTDCQLTDGVVISDELNKLVKELEDEEKSTRTNGLINNTHNFGNCINCTDCKGERTEQDELQVVADKVEAGHKFITSMDDEAISLDKKLTSELTRPCMKCGEPVRKDLIHAECDKCRMGRILNKPLVLSDEQLEEANHELDKQLFTCGDCKLHGKSTCPLDEPPTIPSWTHEICEQFEHKIKSYVLPKYNEGDKCDANLMKDLGKWLTKPSSYVEPGKFVNSPRHMCRCVTCGDTFISGNKRSIYCRKCS